MNGAHDLGGMHGFGPIVRDEAPFHESWELRVRSMMTLMMRRGVFNIDEMRRAIESIPPARYLTLTYFERWAEALKMLAEEKGVCAPAEIDALLGRVREAPEGHSGPPRSGGPALALEVIEALRRHAPAPHAARAARFRPGDRVVAKNVHVKEHTRLPRYVRGKHGVIDRVHGVYTLPDTNAHGRGAHPHPVYSVRFAARELWGEAAAPTDSVYIDLWETYLEPA